MPGRPLLLGIPIDLIGRQETIARLYEAMQQSCNTLFAVPTLNPEYVMAARSSTPFREAIERSDLIVCDGIGSLVAAKAIHGWRASALSRLTGLDLTLLLAKWSAFEDEGGLFLLGGKDAPAAARQLANLAPNARIAGAWSGGSPMEAGDLESIRRIRQSGASVILVAYGAPEQLHWIERNRDALAESGVRIALGVGGVFDYLSGHAALPPSLVRSAGLEWLYRLLREPWRAKRQSVLPLFALLAAREAFERRVYPGSR